MGKKKRKGGQVAREMKQLKRELKGLRKEQKKLQHQVKKLHRSLATANAGRGKAAHGGAVPGGTGAGAPAQGRPSGGGGVLSQTAYPAPMASGKYRGGYAHYRVTEVGHLTPTVMRVVAEPAGKQRLDAQGLTGEYVYLVTGKHGEVLGAPRFEKGKARWDQPTASAKYTVRRFDERSGAVEINIMLHERGAGTTWARTVAVGDDAHFLGPKSGYLISDSYDFYLLAGDESGLPGMARWVESLPPQARGALFVEVPTDASRQVIEAPAGFEVVWVDSTQPGALAQAVMNHPLPEGAVCTWLAGESGAIHPLRIWARRELGVPKGHGYAKGYWKRK